MGGDFGGGWIISWGQKHGKGLGDILRPVQTL